MIITGYCHLLPPTPTYTHHHFHHQSLKPTPNAFQNSSTFDPPPAFTGRGLKCLTREQRFLKCIVIPTRIKHKSITLILALSLTLEYHTVKALLGPDRPRGAAPAAGCVTISL